MLLKKIDGKEKVLESKWIVSDGIRNFLFVGVLDNKEMKGKVEEEFWEFRRK